MIAILVFRDNEGEIDNGIYSNVCNYIESLGKITFTILHDERTARSYTIDNSNLISFIPLQVKGKTYAERKADIEEKAIAWSYAGGVADWSYGELATIQGFFEEMGKRYGLLREFRENAII